MEPPGPSLVRPVPRLVPFTLWRYQVLRRGDADREMPIEALLTW
jgi:hypothetical protein